MKAGNAFKAFKNQTAGDILFDIFNYLILILFTLSILYPLYFIIIASFSDPVAINNGKVLFKPVGFNTLGYQRIFENAKIWNAYGNTIFYTVVGTLINVSLTMMIAYPLSRGNFFARNAILFFVMFTMYFKGGMIPTFLWMHQLNVYNTRFVMLLLPAIK